MTKQTDLQGTPAYASPEQLTGYSAAEFDDDKKTNFKTGMAKYLGVDSAAITITSVVDVTAGRRKLSAVDSVLKVEFTVEATTFSDTTALETKLVVTDVTTMKTELISAGLAVSNIVAPTTITALAPLPSPPPTPSPPCHCSPPRSDRWPGLVARRRRAVANEQLPARQILRTRTWPYSLERAQRRAHVRRCSSGRRRRRACEYSPRHP